MLEFGYIVIWIILIIFGSLSAPFSIWQIGKILRERRRDKMEETRMKAQQQLEELKLKTEYDSRILAGGSAVSENMTAELQALREEVRQIREELNQLKSGVDRNYIS